MSSGEIESNTLGAIVDAVTPQDVMTVIQRSIHNETVTVLNYKLDFYSKDVIGMLNSYWSLKVDFKKKLHDEVNTANFFIKSMPSRNLEQVDYIEPIYFKKESKFFEYVMTALEENCKSVKWGPSCYLAKENMLIMEDLGSQGYQTVSTFFNDISVLKMILATIARFHACSILLESRINQSSKLTTLNEIYPDLFEETMFTRSGASYRWISNNKKLVSSLAKSYGHDSVKLCNAFDKVYDLVKPSKVHRNVICHGDLWTNNVMINNRLPHNKCVLVDFQIVRYAPLVLDILHLLYLHSSSDFRNQHQNNLIQHYHTVLQETVESNNCSSRLKLPTLNDICIAFDDMKVYGAIVACMYTLLGSKISKECSKVPDGHTKFFTGDVMDIIRACMEKNEWYKIRVENVINELGSLSKQI